MMDLDHFIRRLRLLSGIVMFAYIATHLINHGLGIISLAVAESGLRIEMAFWRIPIMTLVLYGAVTIHFFLALWTLYSRRDWRLPWLEIFRLISAFSFPLLLINHAVTTRLGDAVPIANPKGLTRARESVDSLPDGRPLQVAVVRLDQTVLVARCIGSRDPGASAPAQYPAA